MQKRELCLRKRSIDSMCHGSKNGRAKLNEDKVKEIREYYELMGKSLDTNLTGNHRVTSFKKLAKEYHMSATGIGMLIERKTWKHV